MKSGFHCGLQFAVLLAAALLLIGCGGKKPVRTSRLPAPPELPSSRSTVPQTSQPDYGVDPKSKAIYTQIGTASWYGPPYHNRKAADGTVYDMNAMTAAHKTLPLGSIVRVTNMQTGRSALVRINDRGPFVGDRIIDLSLAAAKATDVYRKGLAQVKVEVLSTPSPIDRGGRWCVQIGAFSDYDSAAQLKQKLMRKYQTAKVIQFAGPTGEWVRIRPLNDDKRRAEEVARDTHVSEGGVFLVRLD